MRLPIVILVLSIVGCTIDVGAPNVPAPNITIQCIEIIFPGEHVLYCDGGLVEDSGDAGRRDQ